VILENYGALLNEVERDRRFNAEKWERQERYIRAVEDNLGALLGGFESMNIGNVPGLGGGEINDPPLDAATT
jgi:hypothetical protein